MIEKIKNYFVSNTPYTKKQLTILTVCFLIIVIFLLQTFFFGFGRDFKPIKRIEFKEGETLLSFAETLKKEKVIISKSLFISSIIILGDETKVRSGMYAFEKDGGVFTIAKRVLEGDFRLDAIKITLPEGFTRFQISERLKTVLPNWNEEKFFEETKDLEGYLFPDTYFFNPTDTEKNVIETLTNTFKEKTKEFRKNISEEEFKEKIILASIVEKEIHGEENKKIVAGIFYNRLDIGMPLQADATLAYVTGRGSLALTQDDLASTTPFNTYKNKGLPPAPISNPGIESIQAVFEPTKTKYFYFLTDLSGDIYFAETFEKHKQNKALYLRQK